MTCRFVLRTEGQCPSRRSPLVRKTEQTLSPQFKRHEKVTSLPRSTSTCRSPASDQVQEAYRDSERRPVPDSHVLSRPPDVESESDGQHRDEKRTRMEKKEEASSWSLDRRWGGKGRGANPIRRSVDRGMGGLRGKYRSRWTHQHRNLSSRRTSSPPALSTGSRS